MTKQTHSHDSKRRNFIKTVGVAASFGVAGCSGDGDGDSSPTDGNGGDTGTEGTTVGNGNGQSASLRILHDWDSGEREKIEEIESEFLDENPNVTLLHTSGGVAGVQEKAAQAHAAGDGYDIILVNSPAALVRYKRNGLISPVSDVVEDMGGSDYFADYARPRFDGEDWLVPVYTHPLNHLYREDFHEEAGVPTPPYTEWDEWLDACEQLYDPEQNRYAFPVGSLTYFIGALGVSLLNGNGGHVYNEDGEVVFDSSEGVELLELFRDIDEYSPEAAYSWSIPDQRPPMYNGQLAQTWYGSMYIPSDLENQNPDLRDEVGIAPIPSDDGNDHVCRAGINGLAVGSQSEDIQAAKSYIRHWMSEDSILKYAEARGVASVYGIQPLTQSDSALYDIDVFSEFQDLHQQLQSMMENYGRMVAIEENPGVINPDTGEAISGLYVTNSIEDVVVNDMEPQAAATKWADRMREEI